MGEGRENLELSGGAPERRTQWTERLTRATAGIVEAVTADQVYRAILDQTASAMNAAAAGLWLTMDAEGGPRLCQAAGPHPAGDTARSSTALADAIPPPVLQAIRTGQSSSGIDGAMVCLPLATAGRHLGALAVTFAETRQLDEAERAFLVLVAHASSQALERLRLLEDQKASRARAELLYRLADAVIDAGRVEQVFEAALQAIAPALGTTRAAVLVYDAGDVMRFRAWRGLSDAYRAAVEGHTPWKRDARDPQPVLVADVAQDGSRTDDLPLFQREGIGALAFIPLVSGGRLLGNFMVYYDRPRALAATELDLARAIASHVAAGVARFAAVDALKETVRFNDLFTGILGHDLRNPLAAIITSARLAMGRDTDDRLRKPLARILNSGDRMSRMIDQLLDLTRVRLGGGIPVSCVDLDLAALVRQVMDELEGANPGCVLHLSCAGDTCGRWDPDRLSQVFSNLVANAVRHGQAEHGVQVTLDGASAETVRVEVRNRGAIPPRRMATLFEPMRGRPDGSGGLGLGLFITRELVRAHGGGIQVQSEGGDGSATAFTVTLPRSAPDGAAVG